MMLLFSLLVSLFRPFFVAGHGNMVWPPTWFDIEGSVGLSPGGFMMADQIMWFTNWTFIPGEATLDPSLYTVPDYHDDAYLEWSRAHCLYEPGWLDYDVCFAWYPNNPSHNPWMAPGSAPVWSPCGVGGGNPEGCGPQEGMDPIDCPGGGYSYGPDARDFHWEAAVSTEWTRGSTAEVGWGLIANHGGGYSFRLCKVENNDPGAVTEECFQRTPLKFATEDSWVQYGWDESSRVVFKANRTTEGTFPPGSEWTMNPIPVCNSHVMGWLDPTCPEGTEFPPRGPGLFGAGEHQETAGQPDFLFTIMDEVEVPMDLEPGTYILSFRWDCEATPQIWNACSNINII